MIEELLSPAGITFALGILGMIFTIYHFFRNPQIKTDQETIRTKDEIDALKKSVAEIKETHIKNVEQEIKLLNTTINDLSKTVVRLSTIIEERIPKNS